MDNLNITLRGVIPLAQRDSQGVEFGEDFYTYVVQHELPIYQIIEKPRGRGKQRICEVVGDARAFLKHRVLRVQGNLYKEVSQKPYMRLIYSYCGGESKQINLNSVGLLLSEDAGHLTESNYELIRK